MKIPIIAPGIVETRFSCLAREYPRSVGFRAVFGDPVARRVYAGADLFLMPSRFEPCGLGQQYTPATFPNRNGTTTSNAKSVVVQVRPTLTFHPSGAVEKCAKLALAIP